jgi:hypothetical protein
VTAWDEEPKRLMALAQQAANSSLRGRRRALEPYTPEDLAGELVVFGLDEAAQKARGLYITPDVPEGHILYRLGLVASEWLTEQTKVARAGNEDGIEVFGQRLTQEQTAELGIEVKIGKSLPNEGRVLIENVLGNPEADPGHQRLLSRALERMCSGDGRESRADLLFKKFVRKEKLNQPERVRLVGLIGELTENLNAALLDKPGYEFEGVGVKKFHGSEPTQTNMGFWDEGEKALAPKEPQPLLPGQRFPDSRHQTITLEEYRRSHPKRAASYADYVAQGRVGRVVAPPKSTTDHQYY